MLRQALEEDDAEKLRGLAYSLKSSSANLGAMRFSEQCRRPEISAIEKDLTDATHSIENIEALQALVTAALRAELTKKTEVVTSTESAQIA